jgi:hypothetical protein
VISSFVLLDGGLPLHSCHRGCHRINVPVVLCYTQVVGWEGVIGSIVMLGGALPLLQRLPFEDGSGLAEDSVGSWCMVKSSTSIAGGQELLQMGM